MSKILYHKKLILGILIVLIIALALAFFLGLPRYIGCQLEEYASNVEITEIALRSISLSTLEIDASMKIKNPNSIGAVIDRVTYDIYFQQDEDWIYLGEADRSDDIMIGANDVANVTVTHEVTTLSAVRMILGAFGQQGEILIRAIGRVWLKFGPVTIEVPFDLTRQIMYGSPY